MIEELEKVRAIFDKHFCFTQLQTDEVVQNGGQVMDIEDMEYILSLEGTPKNGLVHFDAESKETYNSEALFNALDKAHKQGADGLALWIATVRFKDEKRIQGLGYYFEPTGHGSTLWDEIYFSEEAYLIMRISKFKNLIGGLKDVSYFLAPS